MVDISPWQSVFNEANLELLVTEQQNLEKYF